MRRGLALLCLLAACAAAPGTAAAGSRNVEVVVTLDAPPLVQALRSSRALTASARRAPLDARSPTSLGYLRDLADEQKAVEARLERVIPGAQVRLRYGVLLDAVSVTLPASEVDRLADVPGVARVWPTVRYRSRLQRTPRLVGAPALWEPQLTTAGQGLKIGIIDDGVDQTHAFFAPRGLAMPAGFPKGQAAYTSAKVIAARAFPPPSPSWKHAAKAFDPEHSVHGTHVAGIAAGGSMTLGGSAISGIAPRAYLGNYRVLTIPTASGVGLDGNSPQIAAGIEAAVRDGMDVINLSLGEPEIEPSRDLVVKAIEAASAAGVVVTVAAGNDFNDFGRGTVGSPASARSAITVGASTKGGEIASFSSSGPTPVSLQLKPEVTAPGDDVVSSVPQHEGTWARFSGTSMAAPHAAGGAALLLQRHPSWTPAQVKSALVQTGGVIAVGRGWRPVQRQGGGVMRLGTADRPLLFASPTTVSFGIMRPGSAVSRSVRLTDAGDGAGAWEVAVQSSGVAGLEIAAPATATVPGELALRVTAGAVEGELTGFVVLRRGNDQRRIPFWALSDRRTLPAPTRRLTRTGTYGGTNAGRVNRVSTYRFPEVPSGTTIPVRLDGGEQVFRVRLARPVANFGVAVLTRARGVSVSPRVVVAGDESRLVGYTALPVNLNPYVREFLRPRLVAGAVRPARGEYDVVFDSPTRAAAGRFTFRFWVDDRTRPTVRLATRSVARGRPLVVAITDAGSGVDPGSLHVSVDGHAVNAPYRRGRVAVPVGGLPAGRHRITVQVSDHQETRNMENEPRILPNTRRFSASFVVR